jgi:ankyrin repeat protein
VDVVKLLLERQDIIVDTKNCIRRSPLSWAAHSRARAVVKLLLEHNNVDSKSRDVHGETPLSLATRYQIRSSCLCHPCTETIRLLFKHNDIAANS